MTVASWVLGVMTFVLSGLHGFQIRTAAGALLLLPKLATAAVSHYLAAAGVLAMALGAASGAWLPAALGGIGALLSGRHAFRAGSARGDFSTAFGDGWTDRIPAALLSRISRRHWSWRLPGSPTPVWRRDLQIPGASGPGGAGRALLCDVWEPPPGVPRTGLGFIYFHGSVWHFFDKDFLTRGFFRHLAGQGHVAVDVAYRLCPETDIFGMVGDMRRSVAWLKKHAADYGVDPERVVIGGGSAGAHIAMMGAYLPGLGDASPGADDAGFPVGLQRFYSDDLIGADTSVAGVVSFYGPTDVKACYEHTGHRLVSAPADLLRQRPRSLTARLLARVLSGPPSPRYGDLSVLREGIDRFMQNALGVGAGEVTDELWSLVSPVAYVRAGVPPTLMFHGDHDCLAPVAGAREFYRRLVGAGARVVYVEYPQTEHAFDIGTVRISPAAQNAVYHLDRFLALLAG